MQMVKSKLMLGGFVVALALIIIGVVDGAALGFMQGLTPGFALAIGAALAAVGWWMARAASGRERVLIEGLRRLSKGDAGVVITPADTSAEVSEVFSALAVSIREQRKAVQAIAPQVVQLGDQVRGIAERCQAAMQMTANGTVEAEGAAHELVQAVEEVARNATEAAGSTHQALKETDSGKVIMTEAMGAMASLGEQIGRASDAVARLGKESQNIGAVLDVIRGIAEQTNLLALNAAIEAARAGEQGRGFAVVADEVRTLASRTQRSTQEIQEMIARLQGEAEGAVGVMHSGTSQASVVEELIENACISLAEIGGAVSSIDSMNTQIASAAEQQHASVQAIHNMIATRGTRGAALETALAELAEVADSLDEVSGQMA